jgi:hypothetical protein
VAATPDPATAAGQLLTDFEARFELGEVPPVPAERIATSLLQLEIDETDDVRSLPDAPQDKGQLSGLLHVPTKTIWLDRREARRYPRRRRFTIAHEIGHWVLHVSNGNVCACRPDEVVDDHRARKLRKAEAEANDFAAELLMPEPLVTEYCKRLGANIVALAEDFDVSVPALKLRLTRLGLLPNWMRSA